jgi:hypothetical protein
VSSTRPLARQSPVVTLLRLAQTPRFTVEQVVAFGIIVALGIDYWQRDMGLPITPRTLVPQSGWWWWTDQHRYLLAAQAWAAGVLDPAQHWYLPGYPLLGALFVHANPVQPFLIPDLVCLLASCAAVAFLAARLCPELIGGRLLGFVAFGVTIFLKRHSIDAWVIPWTTTPVTPLVLVSLGLALTFATRPTQAVAFLAALACAGIALFRLTEALVVLIGVAPFMLLVLLRSGLPWRQRGRIVAASLIGGLVPIILLVSAHVAINGWNLGPYIAESQGTGFEWSLIPLRWATIVLDPHPLFDEQQGLALAFPWFLPGIAGMAACLACVAPGRRAGHILVIGTAIIHLAFYLAYRDFHPQGLWRFNNYHYVKWVLAVLGLYAALLIVHLVGRHRVRALLAGIAVLAVLLPWRAEFVPGAPDRAQVIGPHEVKLAHGFDSPSDGVLVAAAGSWEDIYTGRHSLVVGGRTWYADADFKALPVKGGLLLVPLRPFPHEKTIIQLDDAITLDTGVTPVMGKQRVLFGLPCLVPGWISVCRKVTAISDGP